MLSPAEEAVGAAPANSSTAAMLDNPPPTAQAAAAPLRGTATSKALGCRHRSLASSTRPSIDCRKSREVRVGLSHGGSAPERSGARHRASSKRFKCKAHRALTVVQEAAIFVCGSIALNFPSRKEQPVSR